MDDDLDAFLYGETLDDKQQVQTEAQEAAQESDAESDDLEIVLNPEDVPETRTNTTTIQPSKEVPEVAPLKSININAIGEYNGQSILNIDFDLLEDKPWLKPGADITDYFNYGFTESTWKMYIIKQKELRGYFGGKQFKIDDNDASLQEEKKTEKEDSVSGSHFSERGGQRATSRRDDRDKRDYKRDTESRGDRRYDNYGRDIPQDDYYRDKRRRETSRDRDYRYKRRKD